MDRSNCKVCKAVKLAVKIVMWAAAVLTVGVTAYVMICNMQGKAASVMGISIVKVITPSMEPSVGDGDYIILKKTNAGDLQTGDIICFYSEDEEIYGMLNTHRIVGRHEDGSFITKGDANTAEDKTPVTEDRIVGKYAGKVRLLRWLNSFASLKKLMLAAVMVIMTVTAAYEAVTIARAAKEIKSEDDREAAIRQAIDREKQKLYEQDARESEEREEK
ncbi:MAG: signal peptidase I [Huintestinicola sp.]